MESTGPSAGRALTFGVLAAVGTSVVWAVLSAVFSLHLGLLVVGAFGGWLIGSALKPLADRSRVLALALGAAAVLAGTILDFVISQVALPLASTPLSSRLTIDGYLAFVGGQLDIVRILAIALLLIVAWRSAR